MGSDRPVGGIVDPHRHAGDLVAKPQGDTVAGEDPGVDAARRGRGTLGADREEQASSIRLPTRAACSSVPSGVGARGGGPGQDGVAR